jgi:hypothetical protein
MEGHAEMDMSVAEGGIALAAAHVGAGSVGGKTARSYFQWFNARRRCALARFPMAPKASRTRFALASAHGCSDQLIGNRKAISGLFVTRNWRLMFRIDKTGIELSTSTMRTKIEDRFHEIGPMVI